MTRIALLLFALTLPSALPSMALPSTARADAIGPCPDGQIVVTNPSSPGSGHHGGFHCEPDPNAAHCSVSHGPLDGTVAGVGLALVVALLLRRRS